MLITWGVICAALATRSPDIHRVGNKLIDRTTGKPVVLKGMAMMGGEYMCAKAHGTFAGPANETVVDGMAAWGINAIRLPMNEDCWLGLHDAHTNSTTYQREFVAFVELLLSRGFVVVLDLHWTSSTGALAVGQDLFLSKHSIMFWASVAAHPAFHSRPGVVFELFNEPHDGASSASSAQIPTADPNCTQGIRNRDACCAKTCGVCGGPHCGGLPAPPGFEPWEACCSGSLPKNRSCDTVRPPCNMNPNEPHPAPPHPPTPPAGGSGAINASCYLDGEGCPTATPGFAGYNQAVHAVRAIANATNVILFAGKNWNFDLEWLLSNFPTDPLENCGAAWHPYEFKCKDFSCNSNISGPLTSKYPIFVTEWSPGWPQSNNTPSVPDLYSQRVLNWADSMPGTVQLFPWAWNPKDGKETVNTAKSDYSGNVPTAWGKQYKAWVPKTTTSETTSETTTAVTSASFASPPIVSKPPKWAWTSLGDMAFAHTGQPTIYTSTDLALLSKYPMVQFDKKENVAALPGLGAEDRLIAAAKQVKAANPGVYILMYLNALIDFAAFYRIHNATTADPSLLLRNTRGEPVSILAGANKGVLDVRNPKMRKVFLDAITYGMRSGAFNGVFIDRANWCEQCATRGNWDNETCTTMVPAQRLLLSEITALLGDGNVTLAKEHSGASSTDWQVVNAAMTSDTFCSVYCHASNGCTNATDPASRWTKSDAETCAASITTIATAAARNQLTQSHAMGPFGGTLGADARKFTIAAFLIGAGPLSYFSYANWLTDCWELKGTAWWPEYDYDIGTPTSPANTKINNRSKFKYARNFSSGTRVLVDIYTRKVSIEWGKNKGRDRTSRS